MTVAPFIGSINQQLEPVKNRGEHEVRPYTALPLEGETKRVGGINLPLLRERAGGKGIRLFVSYSLMAL